MYIHYRNAIFTKTKQEKLHEQIQKKLSTVSKRYTI